MGDDVSQLEELGRRVAADQDRGLRGPGGYPELRARLEGAAIGRRRRAPSLVWGVAAAAAIAAVLWLWLGKRSLTLEHAGRSQSGEIGAFIEPSGQAEPLRFSDGSEIVVSPRSRLEVARVSSEAVDVRLDRGRFEARIRSAGRTRWTFLSGPLEVVVTGTELAVGWDPTARRFTLEVSHGSVRVRVLNTGSEQSVAAGQRYELDCNETPAACGAASAAASNEPSGGGPGPKPSAHLDKAPPAPASAAPVASAPSWSSLAARGKYKQALAAIDDFDAACRSAGPDDLWRLANVARFGGSPAKASFALSELRARHKGHPRAGDAAFELGRMAFDGRRSYAAAARWFEAYLAERPGGSFAQEASGRLIECYRGMGAQARAKALAERYLKMYPAGPHADLARSLAHTP
jgi:hypothetical protein